MMEADKPSSKKGGDAMEGSSEGEEEEDAMDDDEYGAPSSAQVRDMLLLRCQLLDACPYMTAATSSFCVPCASICFK